MAQQDEEGDPPPTMTRWLISCDESGVDGSPFYGFGTLWMPWQRRGDFQQLIAEVRSRHSHSYEAKWKSVCRQNLPFYKDLVGTFFRTRWLSFHCLVVRKGLVRKDLHRGGLDEARRKHFTMLLTDKIMRCMRKDPKRERTFRIWVDPIASRYKKADEAVEVISNNVLAKVFGKIRPVDKVLTRDSRDTHSIQLCDVLLGAVVSAWRGQLNEGAKLQLQYEVAQHLGWEDLHADTGPAERKFNVWYFYDKANGPREPETRVVRLRVEIT